MQKKAAEVARFLENFSFTFPIILLYGPNRGAIRENAKKYAENTKIPLEDPFSTIQIEADDIEADPNKLLNEAYTINLFGTKRLIWIKNAAGRHKHLTEQLKQFIKNTPQDTIFLIEAGDLKKNMRLRLIIEQAPNAMALPCYANDARQIYALIEEICETHKLSIETEAKIFLRDHLNADQAAIRNEMEKLCLYCYEKKTIKIQDVKNIVCTDHNLDAEELCSIVLQGDLKKLSLAFEKEQPLLLAILNVQRHIQQMQQMRHNIDTQKISVAEAILKVEPPIFFKKAEMFKKILPFWNAEFISQELNKIYKAIADSRKTPSFEREFFENYLLSLCFKTQKFKLK